MNKVYGVLFVIMFVGCKCIAQDFIITDRQPMVITERTSIVSSEDGEYYVVAFSASWCGPCQTLKRVEVPKLKQRGYKVREIDIDRERAETIGHNISSIPVVMLAETNTRKVVKRWTGYTSADTIETEIKSRSKNKSVTIVKVTNEQLPELSKTQRQVFSHAQLIQMHNKLHGGGNWTWPGDLKTHLKTFHHVELE